MRLRVEELTRRFGGLVAIDGVSFGVAARGVTAVIGPNGAGKTTLFNVISGAMPPSSGRVVLDGQEITGMRPDRVAARGLIRTFQLVRLFPNMSVVENVKVGRHLHTRGGLLAAIMRSSGTRRAEREVEARARELLGMVGLAVPPNGSAATLPYGQQRLLEIARALAAEPKLLLLDEPAAGLNVDETRALAQVIRRIASDGTTVMLIEHDMTLVMGIADHVVVLDFGLKIAEGTPSTVRADPAVIDAYLGSSDFAHA